MSIDSCYENIIAKLTSQSKIVHKSKELLTFKTNHKRVLYVYELINNLNAFPKIEQVDKSFTVSAYYRILGNQCFQNVSNYTAWQYYNLSLLHSPTNSDNYYLSISNRSAVFYELKKYKECLIDIEEILSNEHPKQLDEKLMKRRKLCEEKLSIKLMTDEKIDTEIANILAMQGQKDETYLCASNKIQVAYNKEMGRHVIAKADIKVGEVLVEEDPYFALLLKSQILFSCSYCLSRDLNLMPCDKCCYALYCSKQCKENALKDYHEIECPLMATLIQLEFTKLEHLALRTVIKARNDHENWEALFETIEKADASDEEHKGCRLIDGKWVYDSKYYETIHTLETNVSKRSISDIFQKAVTAAVFLHLLKKKTYFMIADNTEMETKIEDCVSGLLLLHCMTSPTNMHGLSTNVANQEGNFINDIGLASAPYGFLSLLNHSCAPNVVRHSKLGTARCYLMALRPIKKGMQLFDNYGFHHAIQDSFERQTNLKFQYKFNCACEACVNNWPMYIFMSPSPTLPIQIKQRKENLLDPNTISKLQKGDKGTALKLFKPLCVLLGILESYSPCTEQADCQEALKQCLIIFEGVLPFGYSQQVNWTAVPPKI